MNAVSSVKSIFSRCWTPVITRIECLFLFIEKHSSVFFYAILCLFVLQLFALSSIKDVWHDEIFTLFISKQGNPFEIWRTLLSNSGDNNPPLYFVLTSFFIKCFGESPLSLRFPAILSMVASFVVFYQMTKRFLSVWASILLISMVGLCHLNYIAIEARTYSFMVFLAVAAIFFWVKCVESNYSWKWVISLSSCLSFAFLSHFYGALYFVVFGLCGIVESLRCRKLSWKLWISLMIFGSATPMVLYPLIQINSGYREGFHFAPNLTNLKNSYSHWIFYQNFQIAVLFSLIAVSGVSYLRKPNFSQQEEYNSVAGRALYLPLALLALLPVLGYAIALTITNAFYPNYFISSLMALLMIAAILVHQTGKNVRRTVAIIFMFFFSIQATSVGKQFFEGKLNPAVRFESFLDSNKGQLFFTSTKGYVKIWYYIEPKYRDRLNLVYDFYSEFSEEMKEHSVFVNFANHFGINVMSINDVDPHSENFVYTPAKSLPLERLKDRQIRLQELEENYWKITSTNESNSEN